jgi:hypothetical protein
VREVKLFTQLITQLTVVMKQSRCTSGLVGTGASYFADTSYAIVSSYTPISLYINGAIIVATRRVR